MTGWSHIRDRQRRSITTSGLAGKSSTAERSASPVGRWRHMSGSGSWDQTEPNSTHRVSAGKDTLTVENDAFSYPWHVACSWPGSLIAAR